jgi:hypothetical protein
MQTNFYTKVRLFVRSIFSKLRRKRNKSKYYHEVIEITGSGFTVMRNHVIEQYKDKKVKRDD